MMPCVDRDLKVVASPKNMSAMVTATLETSDSEPTIWREVLRCCHLYGSLLSNLSNCNFCEARATTPAKPPVLTRLTKLRTE